MHYVYIIQSIKTDRYYIGSTEDIDKRLKQHNNNSVKSTRNKGPYILIHREEKGTKTEAQKREKQIKRYKGNRSFKELIDKASPSSSLV